MRSSLATNGRDNNGAEITGARFLAAGWAGKSREARGVPAILSTCARDCVLYNKQRMRVRERRGREVAYQRSLGRAREHVHWGERLREQWRGAERARVSCSRRAALRRPIDQPSLLNLASEPCLRPACEICCCCWIFGAAAVAASSLSLSLAPYSAHGSRRLPFFSCLAACRVLDPFPATASAAAASPASAVIEHGAAARDNAKRRGRCYRPTGWRKGEPRSPKSARAPKDRARAALSRARATGGPGGVPGAWPPEWGGGPRRRWEREGARSGTGTGGPRRDAIVRGSERGRDRREIRGENETGRRGEERARSDARRREAAGPGNRGRATLASSRSIAAAPWTAAVGAVLLLLLLRLLHIVRLPLLVFNKGYFDWQELCLIRSWNVSTGWERVMLSHFEFSKVGCAFFPYYNIKMFVSFCLLFVYFYIIE